MNTPLTTVTIDKVHVVEHKGTDIIVGILTGDSDDPGVTEDLASVIVFDGFGTILRRFDRYGNVSVISDNRYTVASGTDRAYWVRKWAEVHEEELDGAVSHLTHTLRTATGELAGVTSLLGSIEVSA